jgi:hypothetical protein
MQVAGDFKVFKWGDTAHDWEGVLHVHAPVVLPVTGVGKGCSRIAERDDQGPEDLVSILLGKPRPARACSVATRAKTLA